MAFGKGNVLVPFGRLRVLLTARLLVCLILWLPFNPAYGAAAADEGQNAAFSALAAAYPDAAFRLVEAEGGDLYLESGGTRVFFSPASGCPQAAFDHAGDPPVCAMLAQAYPAGAGAREPEPGFEPGRVRNEAFFKLLYGGDEEAVRGNLETALFFGEPLRFNARHGAAKALARVAARLEALADRDPALKRYILPVAGHFYWRTIAGSGRLSAHSFGIAIDLNVQYGPYWRWSGRNAPEVRAARARYPQAVVDAFEAEGFIWGGKWHSFDFMHFEYRPELLRPVARPGTESVTAP